MVEIWKPVKGFEGLYEVSSEGRVRSLDRTGVDARGRAYSSTGQIIRPSTGKYGYKRVILYAPGVRAKTGQIHSLVLESFVGPRPPGGVCRHLDGDPANNHLENLTWGTPSENMYDRAAHGTDHQRSKTHCPRGHRLADPNLQGWKMQNGQRSCKACHQARSDQFNGSGLSFEQSADMRYFMIHTGRVFKHGTRRGREQEMFRLAQDWVRRGAPEAGH